MSKLIKYPLFLLLVGEALAISYFKDWVFYGFLILPSVLYVLTRLNGQKIVFPKKIGTALSAFIFFTVISAVLSVFDRQTAIETACFYMTACLIFVYFYNRKHEARLVIDNNIIFGGLILTAVNIFLLVFKHRLNISWPHAGYNLVYAFYEGHNHLGDFLGLGLILSFHKAVKEKKLVYSLITAIFFVFFILSSSRSAYLGLVMVIFIGFWINNKNKTLSILFLVLFSILIFFSKKLPVRLEFYSQAIDSIKVRPFFGVGPGNFSQISYQLVTWMSFLTETAHNIFFDVFSENGLIAGIFFALFIFLVLKKSSKNIYFYLFLYLLVNFQTDYVYRLGSIFILFIILASLLYEEKTSKTADQTEIYGAVSLILLIFALLCLISKMFTISGKPNLGIKVYPWEKTAHNEMIAYYKGKNDCSRIVSLVKQYQDLFPENLKVNLLAAKLYYDCQDKRQAKAITDKLYRNNLFMKDILKDVARALKNEIRRDKLIIELNR